MDGVFVSGYKVKSTPIFSSSFFLLYLQRLVIKNPAKRNTRILEEILWKPPIKTKGKWKKII